MRTLCNARPPLQESRQLLLVSAVTFGRGQNGSTVTSRLSQGASLSQEVVPGAETTCRPTRSLLFRLQAQNPHHPEEGCHLPLNIHPLVHPPSPWKVQRKMGRCPQHACPPLGIQVWWDVALAIVASTGALSTRWAL